MKISLKKQLHPKFSAENYVLHEELERAVEVAIALGQPLLVTGEPGTGKTLLAWKVAHELSKGQSANVAPEPLVFNTKTTSVARDLFYTYDAISHFQAANIRREGGEEERRAAEFIELQALGKAIALTRPDTVDRSRFATALPAEARSSVVLIDEVDKAPRDFPNDILNEVEQYSFAIKEQDNYRIDKAEDRPIVLILTSNSEKNLPDAFLRRCVFYHIPFPGPALLLEIAQKQLGGSTAFTEDALKDIIRKFEAIRKQAVQKAPATAELIAWLRILEMQGYMEQEAKGQQQMLLHNLSALVKTREDLEAVRSFLKGMR